MTIGMRDKGYRFPLYSMDLLGTGSLQKPPLLEVPEGLLFVKPGLWRRGAGFRVGVFEACVGEALSHHALVIDDFGAYGLDAEWAGSMEHWRGRLLSIDAERARLEVARRASSSAHDRALRDGGELWSRLSIASSLSGLGTAIAAGSAPRTLSGLHDGLARARRRIDDGGHGPLLARHGFGAAQRERLEQVLDTLGPQREAAIDRVQAHRRLTGDLKVIRGALLGDLRLLGRLARRVLPAEAAAALRLGRLLLRPGRRRRPLDTAPAAPTSPISEGKKE